MAGKARSQVVKDYIAWPLLSGLAMAALDVALAMRDPEALAGNRRTRLADAVNGRLGRRNGRAVARDAKRGGDRPAQRDARPTRRR